MGKAAGKKRPNAAKNEVVPKGAEFMPGVGLKRLIKAHGKEKAGKSKYRLHAARLRKDARASGRYRGYWVWPTLPSGTGWSACTRAT